MTVMWSLVVSLLVGASTQVGVLRNFGTGPDRQTVLRLKSGAEWTLSGEKLEELRRLAGLQVEVQGSEEDAKHFSVSDYTIIDIGNGIKPLVGFLRRTDSGLGIEMDDGAALPLSLGSKLKMQLSQKIGSKIWIHSKKLASGELRVVQYGVIRDGPVVEKIQEANSPLRP